MAASTIFIPVLPSTIKLPSFQEEAPFCSFRRKAKKRYQAILPMARLFGEATFEESKLKVLILGVDEKKHPGKFQRTYTLTHCDLSSRLTLAISDTINNSQLHGWYNWLQRDEVVAQWKKVKETMSLHVHCHISGGHFFFHLFARLRYFIFCKELPLVLNAFVHGDVNLFRNYPELQEALVWIHFHSNITEFDRMECWGPLKENAATIGGISGPFTIQGHAGAETPSSANQFPTQGRVGAGPLPIGGADQEEKPRQSTSMRNLEFIKPCQEDCDCCFTPMALDWRYSNHDL